MAEVTEVRRHACVSLDITFQVGAGERFWGRVPKFS